MILTFFQPTCTETPKHVIAKQNKNSEELYCVTSFGLKTEVDEIQRDKNYAEHKLVG